jgi:DNA repair protein RecN (Recombination protein N)
MLTQLNIQNFAIIERVELRFKEGFTVITGETGSGKSMLLDALHLILGERADFSIIGPAATKAIVEARFTQNTEVLEWLKLHDIDIDDELLVRREITKEGKSRAFINDSPIALSIQRELANKLFHIHSQFNTIELKDKSYQLELFDYLAGTFDDAKLFRQQFTIFQQDKNKLQLLKDKLFESEKSNDYRLYLKEELSKLNLSIADYVALEQELLLSEHQHGLNEFYNSISTLEDEGNVLETLKKFVHAGEKWVEIDPRTKELCDRISSIRLELKDIASIASSNVGNEEMNSGALNELTQKIDEYNRLLNKHKLHSQEELKILYDELCSQFSNADKLEEEINILEQHLKSEEVRLFDVANALHKARQNSSPSVTQNLCDLLIELNLPDTELLIQLSLSHELGKTGLTLMDWLFSANVGFSPVSIEKAASGGELSRLMLALQKMLSEKKALPTILFDEIDTGVSGEVAEKMGRFLKQMGKQRQIFAISHLPQVAAKANKHFFVRKIKDVSRVTTQILEIADGERIEEIARLMSGEVITESARLTAKALIND